MEMDKACMFKKNKQKLMKMISMNNQLIILTKKRKSKIKISKTLNFKGYETPI